MKLSDVHVTVSKQIPFGFGDDLDFRTDIRFIIFLNTHPIDDINEGNVGEFFDETKLMMYQFQLLGDKFEYTSWRFALTECLVFSLFLIRLFCSHYLYRQNRRGNIFGRVVLFVRQLIFSRRYSDINSKSISSHQHETFQGSCDDARINPFRFW